MPKNGSKSEGKKAGPLSKREISLEHFEGKASGDQGVFLQPVGTQENNPFSPPKQPPTSTTPSESPGNQSPQDIAPDTSED